MGLQRTWLKEKGVADDVVDEIMKQYGGSINAYKEDLANSQEELAKVQGDLQKARAEAETLRKNAESFKVEESEPYKALLGKYSDLENGAKLASLGVNPKYADIVKSKIDFGRFDESSKAVREQFPEFFSAAETKPADKKPPVFGADPQPGGNEPTDEDRIAEQMRKAFSV